MPTGFPIIKPANTNQVASPMEENSTPAFNKPKKNRTISTGCFRACSIIFSKSCACSSAASKNPKARSACGIAGTIGNKPNAGCKPAFIKPYQLIQPPNRYGQKVKYFFFCK